MGHFTYLLIGGGEPFLRDDLAEIVRIFYRNNRVLNVAISTNGSLPQVAVKTVREILKGLANNLTVNVSFDAIADAHDEIRQSPGIFNKAVETYVRLKELKSEYPL
jgi:MoaA/NifB/PqqE/SkfB family radical SAM enzyme